MNAISNKTGFRDRLCCFFPLKSYQFTFMCNAAQQISQVMAKAARAARRLLASLLTRSRQKRDGGNNQGEYSERILAPTCSHRAAGPGQTPPNRLQTTGSTRTRRAAADALRHYVITSRRTGADHVRSRVLLRLFSFITFLSVFYTKNDL